MNKKYIPFSILLPCVHHIKKGKGSPYKRNGKNIYYTSIVHVVFLIYKLNKSTESKIYPIHIILFLNYKISKLKI